ncbi:VOC family protein [Leifsonia bigeumensis]|uniref:Putative pterin-4-alpha-carbinolamine dehydratase n=1 Tax=Leifsonella bigeumensis TaxID=433643 RepID=A0ABP7FMY2_9MICO
MDDSTLSSSDTAERLEGTAFVHLYGKLYGSYATDDFASATALVDEVARAADAMNHHPDIRLGYGTVDLELSSHDAGGVTERDLDLAATIQHVAESLGATIRPRRPAQYAIAIDTVDEAAIRDFWKVGLGYDALGSPEEALLVDPNGAAPVVWFQHMDPPRTDRNRIHLDVYVPTPDAEGRVRAVLEAGGTLVTDEHAPDWWVLADAEGNELCVCTSEK